MVTVQLVNRISRWMAPKAKHTRTKTIPVRLELVPSTEPPLTHDEIMARAIAEQRALANRDCGCGK